MLKKIKQMEKYDIITNIIVVIGAILFMLPLFWLVTNTFKTSSQIYQMPPTILPEHWYIGNLAELFDGQPAFKWIVNSLIVSVSTGFFKFINFIFSGIWFC